MNDGDFIFIPQVDPGDLYYRMGRSLCARQVFSFTLVHYLGLWAGLNPEESQALVSTHLGKALGVLINKLKSTDLMPEGMEDRLNTFRNERNWLVHHVYSQCWEDQYPPNG